MTPEDLTALVRELEDVHADTEDDQAAGVLLRAMGALRVAARYRCAERPTEADRVRAQHLAAVDRDRADALAAANDEKLSTEQRARSQGYADALTRCTSLLAERPVEPEPEQRFARGMRLVFRSAIERWETASAEDRAEMQEVGDLATTLAHIAEQWVMAEVAQHAAERPTDLDPTYRAQES